MDTKELLITDRAKIREKWGKSEGDVLRDVSVIREWLKTQRHLPEIPTDPMIEFFLTNCKYSIEKTKQNLDMYYTTRSIMPEIYRNINPCIPSDIEAAYATGYCVPLKDLTPSLNRVTIFKFKDVDPAMSDIRKLSMHALINLYEVRIHEDLAMGDVFIADYEFLRFGVMARLTPVFLKQTVHILEKVHSSRMKELHLMSPPAYVDTILNLFKSFLSKKLQERLIVHHEFDTLFKYVPQKMLPSDYGGNEMSLKELEKLWKKKVLEYKDRFDTLSKMKVNEDLRPEKLENDEFLGYHGNFKKIDVD